MDESGCLGDRLTRQIDDLVGGKCVAERVISPMHQQCPLGVDHRGSVAECLDASRMRFDDTTSPGSGGENHPPGSVLSGPRPATRLTSLLMSAHLPTSDGTRRARNAGVLMVL